MPTSEYIDNVVRLADLALDAYQPDRLLYRALQPFDDDDRLEDGTLFATVEGGSKDLRSVTAVLGAVQLAFDAAMVVVSYAAERVGEDESERNIDFLRSLASEPTWTLEIEELSDGSFRVKLKALFTTKRGRSTVIASATIATVILAALVPPLGLPLLVVTGVGAAVTVTENALENTVEQLHNRRLARERQAESKPSQPSNPPPEPDDRRREYLRRTREENRLRAENNARADEIRSLKEELTSFKEAFKETVASLTEQVIDLQAARSADVTTIRFEVVTGRQAA